MGLFSNSASVSPASDVMDITPSDTVALRLRQLYVTTGGTLKVDTLNTIGRTLSAIPDRTTLTCVILKVYATGTSATGLIGYA